MAGLHFRDTAIRSTTRLHDALAHTHINPMPSELLVDGNGDADVHGGKQLRPALHERDGESQTLQILSHLQADVTPANDHCPPRLILLHVTPDRQTVLHHIEVEHAGQVEPWDRRLDRGSTGRQQ